MCSGNTKWTQWVIFFKMMEPVKVRRSLVREGDSREVGGGC